MPPLETIEVTVYGMTERSYDEADAGPGAYRQFTRGVRLLLDRGVPFVVKGALLPSNRGEMDEFESLGRDHPGDGHAARLLDVYARRLGLAVRSSPTRGTSRPTWPTCWRGSRRAS